MGNYQFALVWEWMANGNVIEFIKSHADVNRFELVGFARLVTATVVYNPSDSSKTSLRG